MLLGLAARALAKQEPDGSPSELLSEVLDALLEASVTVLGAPASSSYAVDWTDHETWSRPRPKKPAADPDSAQWLPDAAQPAGVNERRALRRARGVLGTRPRANSPGQ
ncbi:MAG: hypothetical protein LC777_05440 [Actinobacteria bacterium]|nr:hypothetical protein [Actinomycetota bacterium]